MEYELALGDHLPTAKVRQQQCSKQQKSHEEMEKLRKARTGLTFEPKQIDVRENLAYKEYYEDYALKSKPVVITGDSVAMTGKHTWDKETLNKHCGKKKVQLRRKLENQHVGDAWAGLEMSGESTLGRFLSESRSGMKMNYLFDWSIATNCPELIRATGLTVPSYVAGDLFQVLEGGSFAADSWPSLLVGSKGILNLES